ncbi:MAG: peptide-methionine (S)-S-oxide reductase MsrA [Candidatus Thermoplasmatota archaeon]|nr:peptide-methionine (S)-S-oxide reductase MsrA [Candidatus Thermoplasmatota archaeon]
MQQATFGAGCFWGVQYTFDQMKGVTKTTVGYMGGSTDNPSYEEVCSDKTGHAEVVHIEFDETRISYEELLTIFWKIHDPTQKNRQGLDVGSQYRSVIFYHSEKQRSEAVKSKEELDKSGKYKRPIVTEIVAASKFYPAENYHQNYFEKHGATGCPV